MVASKGEEFKRHSVFEVRRAEVALGGVWRLALVALKDARNRDDSLGCVSTDPFWKRDERRVEDFSDGL